MTVAAAVLLSMLVSFTLDPMLSSVWPDPDANGPRGNGPIARFLRAAEHLFERVSVFYQRLVAWSLRRRKTVLALAVASFGGSFLLTPFIGSEFVPEADLNEILVYVNTAPGSSLEFTEAKVKQAEAALREFPEVAYTYATINTGVVQGKNYSTVFVRLKERRERARSQKELAHPFRERLGRIAGIEATYVGPYASVSSGKPLQVSIQGPDIAVLERLSGEVMARLRAMTGSGGHRHVAQGGQADDRGTSESRHRQRSGRGRRAGGQRAASAARGRGDQHLEGTGRRELRRARAPAPGRTAQHRGPRSPLRREPAARTPTARRRWWRCDRSRSSCRRWVRRRSIAAT